MPVLKFKAKIWKQANSHVVTIPSDFVKHGNVPEDTDLDFTVEVPE